MGNRPRRAVVLPARDAAERPRVITPDGAIEPLPDELCTDDDIKAAFGADEVFRPPNIDWGRAVCMDGPEVGRTCYSLRSPRGYVILRGSRYVVEDPQADPITLRYESA